MPSTSATHASKTDRDFTRQSSVADQRAWLAERGLSNPYFVPHEGAAGAEIVIAGRQLVNFASYNYLGLAGDPAVSAAAKAAIDRYGTSVSASRIVAGQIPLHAELEAAMAQLHGCEDALCFVSGHLTNVSVIASLAGARDLVLTDSGVHNSAKLGAQLSGAVRRSFPHNDWRALERLLAAQRGAHRRALVIVESVYSMDGDLPDLPRFSEVVRRHGAMLMVDEAHSIGVLGARGRGAAEHFGLPPDAADVWMGTLSKTLASCGGYVAGRRALIDELRHTTSGVVYSVGLPPASAAAALAALRRMNAEPQRIARLRARAGLFRELARAEGWEIGSGEHAAIVPLVLRDSERALRAAERLEQEGIHAPPIVYPAVARNAARLRFFFSSEHSEADIRRAAAAVATVIGSG